MCGKCEMQELFLRIGVAEFGSHMFQFQPSVQCCRLSQYPLSKLQLGGVALGLLAAVFWYGAIELWKRHTDIVHMAH